MNKTLWRIKRRLRFYWWNHRLKLILLFGCFFLTFLTALAVTIVFIVTGRMSERTQGLQLSHQEESTLTSMEGNLARSRSSVLDYLQSSFPGNCRQCVKQLTSSLEEDRGYGISVNYLSLYGCFRDKGLEMSIIEELGILLSRYSADLQDYNKAREKILSNRVSTDKERHSLTSHRLKCSFLPYYLDLVRYSIELGKHIDRFKKEHPPKPLINELLDKILPDIYASASSLSILVNLLRGKEDGAILENYIKPIVESLIGCKFAILQEWRQWKQLLKFEYSVKTGISAASFDNTRFKRDNPVVFLKILLAQYLLSRTKEILGRLMFYVLLEKRARLEVLPEIRRTLKNLQFNQEIKFLLELHHLAKFRSEYNLQIKPIIVAYEEHSRYRLIYLGTFYNLMYQQELMEDFQLQETNFKSGIGAPFWNSFLAHKYREYLKLVTNGLTTRNEMK